MKRKELLIFLAFVLLSFPIAYFNSVADFNSKIQYVEQDVITRVKNIELIGNVIADMPALLGSIEFQSYGQVDIIVEKLMFEDEAIKDFYVLDSELNILHSKQSSYQNEGGYRKSFKGWDKKSPYVNVEGNVFIMKQVGSSQEVNPFFIMFRIFLSDIFELKLNETGVRGVS